MCKHSDVSFVTIDHRKFGGFVTAQCDICGMPLPAYPIPQNVLDDWEASKIRLPLFDIEAAERAIDRALDETLAPTLSPMYAVLGKRKK